MPWPNNFQRLKIDGVISDKEWAYIKKSRKDAVRRKIFLWSAVTAIFLILAATAIYSFQQRGIARQKQSEAEAAQMVAEENLKLLAEEQVKKAEALYNQHLATGKTLMSQSEYTLAIQEFDLALAFKNDGQEAESLKAECVQLSGVSQEFKRLISQGDVLFARGDDYLIDARNRYLAARRLGFQNVLADAKLTTVDDKLPAAFDKFMKNGDIFKRVKNCRRALENYQKALRIRPNDAGLKRKIAECEK